MEFQLQIESAEQIPILFRSRATTIIYTASLNKITNLPEHLRDLPQGICDVSFDNRDYRNTGVGIDATIQALIFK